MKAEHGLGQNHASLVLDAAFPPAAGEDDPEAQARALWTDPAQRRVVEALTAAATALPGTVAGQRKGFTPFSRKVQYAAARPAKGAVRLGLALEPGDDPALSPAGKEGWSERLKSVLVLTGPGDVDAKVEALLRRAWERS
jgi:hypothetical protein